MSTPRQTNVPVPHRFATADPSGSTRILFGNPECLPPHVGVAEIRRDWCVHVDSFIGAPYMDATWIAFVTHVAQQFLPDEEPVGSIAVTMTEVHPNPAGHAGFARPAPVLVHFATRSRAIRSTVLGPASTWRDRGLRVEFIMARR